MMPTWKLNLHKQIKLCYNLGHADCHETTKYEDVSYQIGGMYTIHLNHPILQLSQEDDQLRRMQLNLIQ